MRASHIKVLEMQAKWARYAVAQTVANAEEERDVWGMCADSLARSTPYYMEPKFQELVDHARRTVPDDLEFEESWLASPDGFLWLDNPVQVPTPRVSYELRVLMEQRAKQLGKQLGLTAVSWLRLDQGVYHFTFYLPYDDGYFGCWSYLTIRHGDRLLDRLRKFEAEMAAQGAETTPSSYTDADYDKLHEVRWLFTALHLMAQKLAHTTTEKTSWMARQAANRKKLALATEICVVTLRRARQPQTQSSFQPHEVDWQWQWMVDGHWRKQPYADGSIKIICIQPYIKGPEDKPLKPPTGKMFVARR